MQREFDGIIVSERSLRWETGSIAVHTINGTFIKPPKQGNPRVKGALWTFVAFIILAMGFSVGETEVSIPVIVVALLILIRCFFWFSAPLRARLEIHYGSNTRTFTMSKQGAIDLHEYLDSLHGRPAEVIQYTIDADAIRELKNSGMRREEFNALSRKLSGLEPDKQKDAAAKIRTLQRLLHEGAISQSEYNDQKWSVLASL